jgi:hypothetical protein
MITFNDINTPIYKSLGLLDGRSKIPKLKKKHFQEEWGTTKEVPR